MDFGGITLFLFAKMCKKLNRLTMNCENHEEIYIIENK